MSESDTSTSGAPTELPGGNQGKDTVAYDTYKKAISELKKAKEMNSAFESKFREAEEARLTEEGKFKEMYQSLKEEASKKEQEFKAKESRLVKNTLKNTVARYAKELGAIDEAVDQIYSVGDWASVEFKDDDYSVNQDQVKKLVGEMAQKSPWFFKKSASAPRDVVLGKGMSTGETDMSKMSTDKLIEEYKKLLNK